MCRLKKFRRESERMDAVRDRLIEALGPPRAPTVPRPPGYPADDLEWFRAPGGYNGVEFEDELDTESSGDERSTTSGSEGQGRFDHQSGGSSRRSSNGSSSGSLVLAGLAAGVQGARAQVTTEADESANLEFWMFVGLVVLLSMLCGALVTCWCWRCSSRTGITTEDPHPQCEGSNASGNGDMTPGKSKIELLERSTVTLSPVVNVTIQGSGFEGPIRYAVDSVEPGSSSVEGLRRRGHRGDTARPVDSDSSLGTMGRGRGLVSQGTRQDKSSPVDPSGLGPKGTLRTGAADAGGTNPDPVGSRGLGPRVTLGSSPGQADPTRGDPSGVGPKVTLGFSSGQASSTRGTLTV